MHDRAGFYIIFFVPKIEKRDQKRVKNKVFLNSLKNLVIKLQKKNFWPLFMDGVQLAKLEALQ